MTKSDDKVPALRFKGFTDEWEQRKLGEICKVTKLAGFEFTKYVNYSNTGSILAIRGINVKKGKFNLQDVKYIDNSNFSRLSRSKLQEGDILFTYVGTIGNSAIVPKNVNWYLAPNVCLIRPQDKNSSFISYLIQSDRFQHEEIPKWITTSSQPALSMENIRKFKIILPLNSEQQKISSLVSKIDKLITLQQRKEKQIKLLKKAMLQTLFTTKTVPQLRFKGFTDNWEQHKLNSFLVEYKKKTKINNQYPVLTSSRQGIFFQKDYYDGNQIASKNNIGYNIVPRNYFTYRHMSDDTIFHFNINTLCDYGIVSTLYPVFTTNNQLSSSWLYYYLNYGNDMKRYALLQKQGGSRTYMYLSKLKNMSGHIPSVKEQDNVAKMLLKIDNLIALQQNKTKKLENLKQFLLQNMFI
ncbi:restriction endonuclease subunit S [Lactobacillus johnsonii]|uniref:restriction endonuclease subunit S n=1 Tax=Lactobacillus johnsonii TaxID=33959 RepID=UPI003CFF41C2